MAKNNQKQGKKTDARAPRMAQPLPPPSYEDLLGEIDRLGRTLTTIVQDRQDANGPLDDVQQAQATSAVRELKAARSMFICIQGFAPYRQG